MGPRGLSTFLRYQNLTSIQKRDLVFFRGRTIVVDTSIYMYRFKSEGEHLLYEKFTKMICIFEKYNINAVFIFDGNSPKEKQETLMKRKKRRKDSQKLYDSLVEQPTTSTHLLKKIRREKTTLHSSEIENVKKLIADFGFWYIDAINEADELCAYFVINKMAYACLSDDMDLMLYGVPIIMRYISLLKEEVIMYDTYGILKEMNITLNIFRLICATSGTDYSSEPSEETPISSLFKYYNDYRNDKKNQTFLDIVKRKSILIETSVKMYIIDNKKYSYYQHLNNKEKPLLSHVNELLPNFIFI